MAFDAINGFLRKPKDENEDLQKDLQPTVAQNQPEINTPVDPMQVYRDNNTILLDKMKMMNPQQQGPRQEWMGSLPAQKQMSEDALEAVASGSLSSGSSAKKMRAMYDAAEKPAANFTTKLDSLLDLHNKIEGSAGIPDAKKKEVLAKLLEYIKRQGN